MPPNRPFPIGNASNHRVAGREYHSLPASMVVWGRLNHLMAEHHSSFSSGCLGG